MVEKPSYYSSTLSQILIVTIVAYLIGCIVLVWFKGNEGLEAIKWLVEILLPLYGVRKGVEAVKNGNLPKDPS